jgi:hypothetical protein
MAAEDWISKSDALDIGRRLRPELSDDDLWRILRDHTPGLPLKTIPDPDKGDGTSKIVKWVVDEPPSDGLLVRWDWKAGAYSNVPKFFGPNVKRMFRSIGKPASKTASRKTKRLSAEEKEDLRNLFKAAARETPDGFLRYKDGEDLVNNRYPDKYPRETIRVEMRAAKVVTSKRGRRSKTKLPRPGR